MKRKKTIIIVALIVAIITVGVYLAMKNVRNKTDGKDKTVVMLTEMEDVTYVQYKNEEGTVTLSKTDGAWICEGREELVLTSGYVYEKVAELGKIKGTLITDVGKADCGLEETVYSLIVKNSEKEVRLVLGINEEGHCYAMLEGKSEIFEISAGIFELINLSADAFVAPNEDMHLFMQDTFDDEDVTTEGDSTEEIISDTTTEEITESGESTTDEPIEDSEESDESDL